MLIQWTAIFRQLYRTNSLDLNSAFGLTTSWILPFQMVNCAPMMFICSTLTGLRSYIWAVTMPPKRHMKNWIKICAQSNVVPKWLCLQSVQSGRRRRKRIHLVSLASFIVSLQTEPNRWKIRNEKRIFSEIQLQFSKWFLIRILSLLHKNRCMYLFFTLFIRIYPVLILLELDGQKQEVFDWKFVQLFSWSAYWWSTGLRSPGRRLLQMKSNKFINDGNLINSKFKHNHSISQTRKNLCGDTFKLRY